MVTDMSCPGAQQHDHCIEGEQERNQSEGTDTATLFR